MWQSQLPVITDAKTFAKQLVLAVFCRCFRACQIMNRSHFFGSPTFSQIFACSSCPGRPSSLHNVLFSTDAASSASFPPWRHHHHRQLLALQLPQATWHYYITFVMNIVNMVHKSRWHSCNGVRHINEVKLRQARLVLGLMMTFGESIIPVFIQAAHAHSAWPSLRG